MYKTNNRKLTRQISTGEIEIFVFLDFMMWHKMFTEMVFDFSFEKSDLHNIKFTRFLKFS